MQGVWILYIAEWHLFFLGATGSACTQMHGCQPHSVMPVQVSMRVRHEPLFPSVMSIMICGSLDGRLYFKWVQFLHQHTIVLGLKMHSRTLSFQPVVLSGASQSKSGPSLLCTTFHLLSHFILLFFAICMIWNTSNSYYMLPICCA